MPPRRQTAHSQLDERRQKVGSESMKLRELQEQAARARAELDRIGDTIAAAYATEDPRAITDARQAKEDTMARLEDLEHRVAGAELRVQRAKQELDEFLRDQSRELLAEREKPAREVAERLSAAVAEVVKARAAYDAERQHVDQLVAKVPGASVRNDGVSTSYALEGPLRELERAWRSHPQIDPPAPRWSGLMIRRQTDEVHARLKERRRKPNEGLVDAVQPGGGG